MLQFMRSGLRNMTTLTEPMLNIHLTMEKTAAREGSGFHVEQNPPENVRKARAQVPGASFTKAMTTPLPEPKLVCMSPDALRLLQDPAAPLLSSKDAKLALTHLIAGTGPREGLAHCYAGHQFGHFSGQLGDGAAILLGGVDEWEAQLKGAGLTAFSRTADGRKVLRSTLREFLASEHMHALHIPTTRAGGVAVSTTETVLRDMFYDGNAQHEPCANVLRIAQTFIRFGSFEIFKPMDKTTGRAGPSAHLPLVRTVTSAVVSDLPPFKDTQRATLRAMLTFVQRQYYHIETDDFEAATRQFVEALVTRTAALVAKWQTVGFCHGVLNTDNLSIVGDTLDYGPYGYMEYFNPKHICNTSDDSGRYSYENQPEMCKWNCHMLVRQFGILFDDATIDAMHALVDTTFDRTFATEMETQMAAKLGLVPRDTANAAVVASFWTTLTDTHADFTCTFRSLSGVSLADVTASVETVLAELVAVSHTLEQAQAAARPSVSPAQVTHLRQLLASNPQKALMYGITHEAVDELADALKAYAAFQATETTPQEYKQVQETRWRLWLDQYVAHLQAQGHADDARRREAMDAVNPKYILRNHVAQAAIDAAAAGSEAGVAHILHLLTHPFDAGLACDAQMYSRPLDPTAPPLLVSCSS
ncbi:Aste57867_24419 [Aphanomyces stellatus]|uniref:Selenoprotein O n=1 Tax=Aphanomyces stellatus TaxID=120398 RepID=A0A485LQB4_9STRA|nr:hypothetical protein As57867_024343 [Aphanomyces stellatus]VFU01059.1 Aste57867_24419 [Aphanomyces stellatus]